MKIFVASTNPVKINATRTAFELVFPNQTLEVTGFSAPSLVPDQPMGDDETRRGAYNRVQNLRAAQAGADFYVGLEGGVVFMPDGQGTEQMYTTAWMVCSDAAGNFGEGRAASCVMPPAVADLVKQGKELGVADDIVFGQTNSKQQAGGVGLLTHGVIDRTAYYVQPLVLALVPFVQQQYYKQVQAA